MKVLVTGLRAPAALEICHHLSRSHEVFGADSVYFALCRGSQSVKKFFLIPSPRNTPHLFKDKLISIIKSENIDLLIPTCEEIFFISFFKNDIEKFCDVFCDEHDKLKMLHSKWRFLKTLDNFDVAAPDSYCITDFSKLNEDIMQNSKNLVFKSEFSRFASSVFISPQKTDMRKLNISESNPLLVQKRIFGTEYCTYGIAHYGKLVAHSCYKPVYKFGVGSGIYFQSISHTKILNFCEEFCKKNTFHGQIGFDFIDSTEGQLFALECNPRTTSGVHLFSFVENLACAFESGSKQSLLKAQTKQAKMNALAMIISSIKLLFSPRQIIQFLKDFWKAKDTLFKLKDPAPFFFQFLLTFEFLTKSVFKKIKLRSAMTHDIEWNEEISSRETFK